MPWEIIPPAIPPLDGIILGALVFGRFILLSPPQLLANIGASATERGMILLSSHVGRIIQPANSRRNHVQSGTENPDQLATVSQKVVTVLNIQC